MNLALGTSHTALIQVYRIHESTQSAVLVAESNPTVVPHEVAMDHDVFRELYHRHEPYQGPIHQALMVESSSGEPLSQGVCLPIMRGDRVWGLLAAYSGGIIDKEQSASLTQVVQLLEHLLAEDKKPHIRAWRAVASTRGFEAEERFRREIAEELHGTIQTKLLLISFKLERLKETGVLFNQEGLTRYEEVLDELENVREQDIRMLSHRLHPGLIRVGLRPALQQLQQAFHRHTVVNLQWGSEIAAYDHPVENRIASPLRLVAYRVVEESILNAVRHGRAKNVDVKISVVSGQWLSIAVCDDGSGFEYVGDGFGLTLMRGRVKEVHGTFSMVSTPGTGCQVEVRLPLPLGPQFGASSPRERVLA